MSSSHFDDSIPNEIVIAHIFSHLNLEQQIHARRVSTLWKTHADTLAKVRMQLFFPEIYKRLIDTRYAQIMGPVNWQNQLRSALMKYCPDFTEAELMDYFAIRTCNIAKIDAMLDAPDALKHILIKDYQGKTIFDYLAQHPNQAERQKILTKIFFILSAALPDVKHSAAGIVYYTTKLHFDWNGIFTLPDRLKFPAVLLIACACNQHEIAKEILDQLRIKKHPQLQSIELALASLAQKYKHQETLSVINATTMDVASSDEDFFNLASSIQTSEKSLNDFIQNGDLDAVILLLNAGAQLTQESLTNIIQHKQLHILEHLSRQPQYQGTLIRLFDLMSGSNDDELISEFGLAEENSSLDTLELAMSYPMLTLVRKYAELSIQVLHRHLNHFTLDIYRDHTQAIIELSREINASPNPLNIDYSVNLLHQLISSLPSHHFIHTVPNLLALIHAGADPHKKGWANISAIERIKRIYVDQHAQTFINNNLCVNMNSEMSVRSDSRMVTAST